MGYNGDNTYGVRVDSSRYADSANTINNSGHTLTFNWSGQGGQPYWLYGGNDPLNAYVYNPSNFSVNYANSAGYAGSVAATSVASATAGIVAGAVGSYATGIFEYGTARTVGSTYAGSTLVVYNTTTSSSLVPVKLSGTWRFLGASTVSSGLFLRIA